MYVLYLVTLYFDCFADTVSSQVELRAKFTDFEPISSILTLKALKSTPKLGSVAKADPRPRSQVDVGSMSELLPLIYEEYDVSTIAMDDVL